MLIIAATVSGVVAMAKDIHDINLLPNKGEHFLTTFLDWSLTVGRLLIIFTETLALSVFLYRFSLDMKIVDLHDQIKQKSFIVKSFKSSEDKFRNLQSSLALAKKYDSLQDITPSITRDVIALGRGKVTFHNVLIQSDLIKIEAQARTSNALSAYVNSLKHYPGITAISIDKVENKTTETTVTIGLTAYLQTAQTPKPTPSTRINPNGVTPN